MTRAALAVSAVVVAGALSGCPKSTTAPPTTVQCATRADCPGGDASGLVCTSGHCTECARDRECKPQELCHPIQRRCVLRPCFGNQCVQHSDCALGQFCVQGLCLKASGNAGNCPVTPCDPSTDCGTNRRCNPATLVCEENLGCQADADCPAGQACNPGTGKCEPGCTTMNAAQICGVKLKCLGGRCVECQMNADCGVGLSCDTAAGKCIGGSSCFTSRDCNVPLVCNPSTHACTTSIPSCTSDEMCAQGYVCQVSTGACVLNPCGPDHKNPNGTLATALALWPGEHSGYTLCPGEQDYYKLALQSGDRIDALVETDPLLNFELDFLDGTGAQLASGALELGAQAGAGGDYYLRAKSMDAVVSYGLRLSLSHGQPCVEDAFDPNNDYLHAHPVDASQYYNLKLCPGAEDWFVARVGHGQELTARLDDDPTMGLVDLYLYDSDGRTVIGQDVTTSGTKTLQAGAASSGLVYVRVAGDSKGVQNAYDLAVKVTGP